MPLHEPTSFVNIPLHGEWIRVKLAWHRLEAVLCFCFCQT